MVMGLFSVFWLSFGVIQLPTLNLSLPYATSGDPTGTASPAFNTDVGLYLLVWGFALLTFFIFTLKINTVFALIFGLVSVACWILAGACEFISYFFRFFSPLSKRFYFGSEMGERVVPSSLSGVSHKKKERKISLGLDE